jgi:predicted ribosomally synthesized peptide with SipW-like signal peptide
VKKILFAVMAIVAAVGLVGGAFAYFSDVETSEENTFSAGYLDMEMYDGTAWQNNSPFPLAQVANLAPGEVTDRYGMWLRNIGNISGKVKVEFEYTDADATTQVGEFAGQNISGEAFAKALIVKEAWLDSDPDNKAPYWISAILTAGPYANEAAAETAGAIYKDGSVYVPTVYGLTLPGVELKFYPAYPTEEEWIQNEQHYEAWVFMLNPTVENEYMFDGVDITLTATMIQFDALWQP